MAGTVPILIEFDENAPIKSLAQLHRIPGLAKIHFSFDVFDRPRQARKQMLNPQSNGVPQLAAPKKNGARVGPGTADGFSPSQAVIKVLEAHGGPMTRSQIKEAGGVNGARMLTNITSMRKMGSVIKVGAATYDLPDRKATTASGPTPKTGIDIILGVLSQKKKGETASKKEFSDAFEMNGRSKKSVNDACAKAIGAKKIKRVARNAFELV